MHCQESARKQPDGQAELLIFQVLAAHGGIERAFDAWLAYTRISKSFLARSIGVDMTVLLRYWRRGRAPRARLDQLRELGIPEFLLPPPTRGRSKGRGGNTKP